MRKPDGVTHGSPAGRRAPARGRTPPGRPRQRAGSAFLVVLEAEVRDELLTGQVAERVLELGLLDEEVVLGIEAFRVHRALEEEREPLLDALHPRSRREIHA